MLGVHEDRPGTVEKVNSNRSPPAVVPCLAKKFFALTVLRANPMFITLTAVNLHYMRNTVFFLPILGFASLTVLLGQPILTSPEQTHSSNPQQLSQRLSTVIKWSRNPVEATLSPNETSSADITISSDRELENVTLQPVPEVTGVLSIYPSSIDRISAGQPVTISLIFSVPSDSPLGTIEGTVHIRSGNRTYPHTLKVIIKIWNEYRNDDSGFSLKTPPNWILSESEEVQNDLNTKNLLIHFAGTAGGEAFLSVIVARQSLLASGNPSLAESNPLSSIENQQTILVDGINAVQTEITGPASPRLTLIRFSHQGNSYSISYDYPNRDRHYNDHTRKTIDTMIKSFKLLD